MSLEKIKTRMQELGIEAKKALGQNFLISDRAVEKIVTAASRQNPDLIIEIGPGIGAITDDLLNLQKPMKLLELDSKLAQYWRDRGGDVIEGDALEVEWPKAQGKTILVSNLPYQISSRIVIDRTVEPHDLDAMILMFQKEVAQRISAPAKTRDRGVLTVMAQTFWDVKTLLDLGPRDFYPAPKVSSRVLVFKNRNRTDIDRERFLGFVKACFAQKRKLLKGNLLTRYSKDQLGDYLGRVLKETARAEELSNKEFEELYFHLENKNG